MSSVNPARDFETLYLSHREAILRYASRRLPREDALEVAAETFAVAWRRFDQVPLEPLPWLYRVAHLQAMNRARRLGRDRSLVQRLWSRTPTAAAVDEAIVGAEVASAVRSLRPADREVIRLVALEGLGPAAVAMVLGCSPGAAAVRIHRARRRLGEAMRLDAPEARNVTGGSDHVRGKQ